MKINSSAYDYKINDEYNQMNLHIEFIDYIAYSRSSSLWRTSIQLS